MLCHFLWFLVAVTAKASEIRKTYDGPEIQLLNVDKVWRKGITGKGIVVAVVDNGVVDDCNDLKENYNATLSFDFVNSTTSRQARSHGTRCAGVIAGKRNGRCRNGGGIAYNAQLADLKILNGAFALDNDTANALGYKNHQIEIYSNSWGPSDNGYLIHGPGRIVKHALKEGVNLGRRGRGSIFVFSTGNGGGFQDSCAFDGYINSIYTIAIGAVTKFGKTPHYAEPCSSVMAAAYGDNVKTCDVTGCVNDFGRTSGAAAMASGIIALLLEATNNTLTWRDVHHLIVRTCRPNQEVNEGNDWIVNGVGLMVHPFLGFGIIDANRLVEVATKNWKTVPEQKSCTITFKLTRQLTFKRTKKSFVIDTNLNENCSRINHIEQVQVEFSLSFERRGLLQMYLESPLTTKSKLIYERMYDTLTRRKTFNNLPVTSLHFWGESVNAKGGKWKISFESRLSSFQKGHAEGKLSKFKVTFYGTEEDPIRYSGFTKDVTFCEYGNRTTKFWAAYGRSCCGSLGVYDESRAKCCNNRTIVQKDSFCGRLRYDQCTQICCDGKIHKKMEGTACCGEKTYNTKTQICCEKRPAAKFKCKRVGSWYWGYSLKNAEAVCYPSYGLYYRVKRDESCRDPCADNPCKNGGQCSGNTEKYTFTCTCDEGYQGETCAEKVSATACTDNLGKQFCERRKNAGLCSEMFSYHYCGKTCAHC